MLRAVRTMGLLALVAAGPAVDLVPKPPPMYGPPAPSPFDLCDYGIAAAQSRAVPPALLPAIARVESGRPDPVKKKTRPWPWTINVEGVGSFHETKADVIAVVQALQAKGIRSIDVGCMQVNLFHHPNAFPDLETAFDPGANAAYAARFLSSLYGISKNWNLAVAAYHSQTQERGEEYQRRVFGRVMTPMGPGQVAAGPYGVWPPPGTAYGAMPPATFAFGAFAPAAAPPPAKIPPLLKNGQR